ncbi:MAG: HAMP domain-containing histidine kinase, partial [Myxococcales bacterium]|nr:HAMP domain-containing histidine kinase [Myxococcales bacterium]
THELRTPLHGIGAVTELLESEVYGPLTERQRRAMGEIAQSAEGLEKLVDDLLLLAKADAGKLEPRLAPVNVDEVVQGVVAGLRWMADLKEHEVEVLPLGGDPLPIRSDRAQLAQILVNLVSNAIKFTPPRGRISVAARRHEEGVEIAVSDTGIGIADEELETIFDEFHQVDGTDERKHGGIGLGLALVKRLAASLGASIEVTSRYGEGSTFRIRLPMAPPAEEAEAEKTEAL